MGSTAKRNDPALWEKVKAEVTRSDKGGRPGQWSARKAQLSVQQYKQRGGTYTGPKREDNNLRQWTEEEWDTQSGQRSTDTGERYLPKRARETLTPQEYRRTTAKKRADTAKGRQFSAQPPDVARKTSGARQAASAPAPTRAALLEEARRRAVPGRSRMNKQELADALRRR